MYMYNIIHSFMYVCILNTLYSAHVHKVLYCCRHWLVLVMWHMLLSQPEHQTQNVPTSKPTTYMYMCLELFMWKCSFCLFGFDDVCCSGLLGYMWVAGLSFYTALPP